ncbi:MAG TPA: YdeI/OmpD-associated family protein [Herpetosiphonaceae bacterium]
MAITYATTVVQAEGKQATGIPVPAEVLAGLGGQKRPKVAVTLNGYAYRTTVGGYGDAAMVPLSAAHRQAAGLAAGDAVEVTIELDEAPRTVEVPADLQAALEGAGAAAAFEAAAPSARKEWVRQVEEAKAAATRERRIAAIIAKLAPT